MRDGPLPSSLLASLRSHGPIPSPDPIGRSTAVQTHRAAETELDDWALMEPRRGGRWCLVSLLLFSLLFYRGGRCSKTISADALDSVVRDHAFRVLLRRRTGVVYEVPIPASLSGVEASVIRVRSRSFWSRGADIGGAAVRFPPRTIPVPPVRRWVVVRQNLGNWSFLYDQNVPGYDLVAPVVGLLAYDDSNTSSAAPTELDLRVTGDPISISFPQVTLPTGSNITAAKCARFGSRGGEAHIGDMASPGLCLTRSTGHFAVVVPSNVSVVVVVVGRGGGRRWVVWVIACGAVGLVLVVGLVGVGLCKLRGVKRMEEMVRNGGDGEALGTVWVVGSRMPSATMTRTQPAIENGTAPS